MTTTDLAEDNAVWYVGYGSNLLTRRFACYLAGGRPHGARRTYDGCRDPSPPTAEVGVHLAGGLHFGGESRVWGGGLAFYDPTARRELAARAYRITFGQLSDVVAQETRRPVGTRLLPGPEPGRPWPTESEVYESVLHLGDRDGLPMFCLTSLQTLTPVAPSTAYLRTILAGLSEAFDWGPERSADYLLQAPGLGLAWTRAELVSLGRAGAPQRNAGSADDPDDLVG